MELLNDIYFADYKAQLGIDVGAAVQNIAARPLTPQSFTFYTSVAVMSSSRIEGEILEIDSYVKHKMLDIEYLPELVEKPNDLYDAYRFAQQNILSLQNFLHTHNLLTKHLLPQQWRGVYRKTGMLVLEHNTGRIQFEAAPSNAAEQEMKLLWQDIERLKKKDLTLEEVFYYAAFIHLVFVCIHPFNDGNGRAARLLEKWFLAAHLGEKAWYINSEKYYYSYINDYYKNLNRLGVFYEQSDYSQALPFLLMLPNSLKP